MKERKLPTDVQLVIGLDEPEDEAALRRLAAAKLRIDEAELPELALRKRSLDARGGRIRFHLLLELLDDAPQPAPEMPRAGRPETEGRVVIVGDGPAGLFCAYQLARLGVSSTVLDRGKQVQPRRVDLKGLNRKGVVDADSNYCFGEGGAGTYSDGKLYTRSHKRGDVRDVLEILHCHGAPRAILTDARPHIGSNRLPKVVTALRERLEGVGVQFRFGARVSDILRDDRRVLGVRLVDGEEIAAEHVVLATGHSASDIVEMLHHAGHPLEAKAFAMGVRIEHPQALVNRKQYGASAGHPKLPSAAYKLVDSRAERAVFSFCMCPGGFIVPASTEPGGLVVNGMSLSRRDSPFANSGVVVGVEPEDVERAGFPGVLGGIAAQRAMEALAFQAGGNMLEAPATRITDFLASRASTTVPGSSYIPGLVATDIGEVLDGTDLRLAEPLRRAIRQFDRNFRGYITEEAVLVGCESRTSSPVRVPRNADLMSDHWAGLYPCGEGAGYAGGIVSAAVDGMRVARSVAARLLCAAR